MTDEELMIIVGNRIRARRLELKLSVKDVLDRTGMAESTYKRIEAGKNKMPRLDTLMTIARGLQIDLNSLVPQEHMVEDPGVWQVERKLLGLKKGVRDKVVKAILGMIDAFADNS